MRFVATADWQLGMTARFLPEEARARFHEARLEAVRRIGEVATEHGADFVLVAGDVFESNQLDRVVVARALDAMRAIEVPVWLLPGNHDPLDAASVYTSEEFDRLRPDHVRVLDRPGVHEAAEGVDLVAAPWFSKRPLSDLVAEVVADLEPDPERTRIVVGHGAVWSADRDDPAAIDSGALERVFASEAAHFAVLGDRHSVTEVGSRTWYPGTPEVTDRRETDPGRVLVVEIGQRDVVVTPVRVGSWTFSTLEAELTGAADVDELIARLQAHADRRRSALWLALRGALTLGDKARLDAALEDQAGHFALLEHWQRHTDLAVLPADGEWGDLGLSGWARDALTELAERADDEPAARDALSLLYRFSGGGR